MYLCGKKKMEHIRTDFGLLERARTCWDAASGFRADRDRNKRFTYGDQWSDLVDDGVSKVPEETLIRRQGNTPLKNNLIRRLVRNVLGVYRNRWTLPECVARDPAESVRTATMQRLMHFNIATNRMEELYSRSMEEFLIGGLVVHKKWFVSKGNRTDCWTDFVQPDRFIIDPSTRDFRGWDITLVGEIHDMSFDELCSSFCTSAEERKALRDIYRTDNGGVTQTVPFGSGERSPSFHTPANAGACRVIEIWTLEHPSRYACHDTASGRRFRVNEEDYDRIVVQENRRRILQCEKDLSLPRLIEARWRTDEEWHYHFITPDGQVIREGASPYSHGSHPYVFKAYPFIDGEIHSFVSDIIDQQKVTNRLISMYDWILRASAKGVLLFPEESLPQGVCIDDIADEWSRFNGVILFRPRAGIPLPQQVSSKCADIGITDLLNIQMKMMEDISGVNGALQGKLDSSTMSGTLYDQQTRNSLTALADIMGSFEDFMAEAIRKDASNIRQYYSPRRIEAVTGLHPGLTSDLRPSRNFFSPDLDFGWRLRNT